MRGGGGAIVPSLDVKLQHKIEHAQNFVKALISALRLSLVVADSLFLALMSLRGLNHV